MAVTLTIDLPLGNLEEAEAGVLRIDDSVRKIHNSINSADKAIAGMCNNISRFDDICDKAVKRLKNMTKENFQVLISIIDHISPILDIIQQKISSLSGSVVEIGLKLTDQAVEALEGVTNQSAMQQPANNTLSGGSSFTNKVQKAVATEEKSTSLMERISSVESSKSELVTKLDDFGKAVPGIIPTGTKDKLSTVLDDKFISGAISIFDSQLVQSGSKLGGIADFVTQKFGDAGLAGSVVGVAAAGQSFISAGKDVKKVFEAEKTSEKIAYGASAASKGIGTVAGFMLGGPVGSAIGSKVGEVVGGTIVKVNENREMKKEQKKFESEELRKAYADENVSVEEFNQLFSDIVDKDMENHFGNVSLTLDQIKQKAQEITFANSLESMQRFSEASAKVQEDLSTLSAAYSGMDKITWKAGLGALDESEIASFKEQAEQMITSAGDYIESRQYEFTTSVNLLVNSEQSEGMIDRANEMYASMQAELDELDAKLMSKIEMGFDVDGNISAADLDEIREIQKEISDITNSFAQAEQTAELKAIAIKYGGTELDRDSFTQLQAELGQQVEEAVQLQDEALKVGIMNLELELERGIIDQERYEQDLQTLMDDYEFNVKEIKANAQNFQLGTIAKSYEKHLDKIMPGIEGTTADKLEQAMKNAAEKGYDLSELTSIQVAELLEVGDTGAISNEVLEELAQLLGQASLQLPEIESGGMSVSEIADMDTAAAAAPGGISAVSSDSVAAAVEESGWLENLSTAVHKFFTETLPEKWTNLWDSVGEFFSATIPQWWQGLTEKVAVFFTETIPEKWEEFWNSIGEFFMETLPMGIGAVIADIEMFFTETLPGFFGNLWEGLTGFFTETIPQWISDLWETAVVFFTETLPGFFENLWEGLTGFFTETIPQWASDIWETVAVFFGETIPGFFDDLWQSIISFFNEAVPSIAATIWGSIKSFFTDIIPGFLGDIWDGVKGWAGNVKSGYEERKSGSGTKAYANGGILSTPHLGLVAEDGPEAIIPLASGRRSRGIELWQQAGELLGVLDTSAAASDVNLSKYHPVMPAAEIASDYPTGTGVSFIPAQEAESYNVFSQEENTKSEGSAVEVSVNVSPVFEITSSDNEEDIVAIIKKHMKEMADDLGGEIAVNLEKVFSNMPVKAEV